MRIILLITQIVTESLPISSSTHVHAVQFMLGRLGYYEELPRPLLWCVHGVTALLMVLLLSHVWWPLLRHPWRCRWILRRLAWYGLCAELVTVCIYGALYMVRVTDVSPVWGLLVTAVTLCMSHPHPFLSKKHVFFHWILLGFAQGIAVIPGISRLAITYSVARWCGYSGLHAWRMSCTLAIPLFLAASAVGSYEIMYDSALRSFFTVPVVMELTIATAIAACTLLITRYAMIRDRVYYFSWYLLLFAGCYLSLL